MVSSSYIIASFLTKGRGGEYKVLSQATPHSRSRTCLWPPPFADAASKHATQAFFDCLRAEVEQHEVKVTVVSPGYIRTNLSVNAVTADGSRHGGEARFLFPFTEGCWLAAGRRRALR